MGMPPTQTSPHLYPQAIQIKLYQAFIFSIPILFSIILFLLFYLFYLKRRASSALSNSQAALPTTSNQPTPYLTSSCQMDVKLELKDKLPIILFDEELKTRDSQCCVCLGDFEIKEELLQVPLCKHVFHADCMHHWLHSNSTCPLCRCSVIPPTTFSGPPPHNSLELPSQDILSPNQNAHNISSQQHQIAHDSSNISNFSSEQIAVPIEGTPSIDSCLSTQSQMGSSDRDQSVVIHISSQNS